MKAIALFSGGLDSSLAVKVIADQGISVVALHFLPPFSKKTQEVVFEKLSETIALCPNTQLRVICLGDDFMDMVKKPHYGYGSVYNPCIDCKILMLEHVRSIMNEISASFVITGEVVGQRPMSQYKDALKRIERDAGLEGLVVRPLSAQILPETIPEQKGWIERKKLYAFSGRGRTAQMQLAKQLGITEYPWPSGGCLLTEPAFAPRVKDLLTHGPWSVDDARLLAIGRHFRLNDTIKLIMGRDHLENQVLESMPLLADWYLWPNKGKGPLAMIRGTVEEKDINTAAQIMARYIKYKGNPVPVAIGKKMLQVDNVIMATALDEKTIASVRI